MNKEKQIEEMTEYLNNVINVERNSYFGKGCITMPLIEADKILDILKGYRKASDVAREIFEEIENALELLRKCIAEGRKNDGIKYQQLHDGRILSLEAIKYFTTELKKKYESEKDD